MNQPSHSIQKSFAKEFCRLDLGVDTSVPDLFVDFKMLAKWRKDGLNYAKGNMTPEDQVSSAPLTQATL